jgi:DNA-binding XRE family transcriptional regulator
MAQGETNAVPRRVLKDGVKEEHLWQLSAYWQAALRSPFRGIAGDVVVPYTGGRGLNSPAGSTSPTDSGRESGARLQGNRHLAGYTREVHVLLLAMHITAGNLGTELRALREMRGVSRKQLAAQLNIAVAQVTQIENGYYVPGLATISRVAEALDARLELIPEEGDLNEAGDLPSNRGGPRETT